MWVISLNERVENGEIVQYDEENARVENTVNAVIPRIDIHCRKEKWPSGKHEVHIRAFVTWYASINPSTGNSSYSAPGGLGGSEFTGRKILEVKIKKKDVRGSSWVNSLILPKFDYGQYWFPENSGDYLMYVIFEKDGFPANVNYTSSFGPPGTADSDKTKIGYRSNDSAWIFGTIHDSQAGSYSATNGCIRLYTEWQ